MVDRINNSAVEYQVQRNDYTTDALITGYEVTRFGIPMIGKYVNTHTGRRVTICPAVPGAQYRITAWALYGNFNGPRSATPAVVDATTGGASECYRCYLSLVLYIVSYPVHCTLLLDYRKTCKPSQLARRYPLSLFLATNIALMHPTATYLCPRWSTHCATDMQSWY